MAFIIDLTPTYAIRVDVEIPNQKGKLDKSSFMAEFKRLELEELDELRKKPQREVIKEVLVGWSELLDKDRQPVPYNEATQAALLAIPQATMAMIEKFWESVYKAKEKN